MFKYLNDFIIMCLLLILHGIEICAYANGSYFEATSEGHDWLMTLVSRNNYPGVKIDMYLVADTLDLKSQHPLTPSEQCIFMNKRILQEQLHCDFAIIAKNGFKFECHKVFLAGELHDGYNFNSIHLRPINLVQL